LHQTALNEQATEKERYEAALLIDKLIEDCEQVWEIRDYVERFGKMPENKTSKALSTEEKLRRLATVNTYVSRYRNKAGHLAKFEKYSAEKLKLEQDLGFISQQ
jgi:hypothetical protein